MDEKEAKNPSRFVSIIGKMNINRIMFYSILVMPLVLSILYFSFFAVNRYVSNSQILVKQLDEENSSVPGLALLTGGVDNASQEYALYLQVYIQSYDMLEQLEDKMQWSSHYLGHYVDPLYHLADDTPKEDLLRYYNKMVKVTLDANTGLLDIEAQAFTPEIAKQTVDEIVAASQAFIDKLSKQTTTKKLAYAEHELKLAAIKYEEEKAKLVQFQNQHQLIDADANLETMTSINAELESKIVANKAQLKVLQRTLPSAAPQITQLKVQIQALEDQLTIEKEKSTSSHDDKNALNELYSQYRSLTVNTKVAEEFYSTSLAVLENTKYELMKSARTLLKVVQPTLADIPIYPRVIYDLITILLILLFIYGVTRFIVAAIKDHYE